MGRHQKDLSLHRYTVGCTLPLHKIQKANEMKLNLTEILENAVDILFLKI